MIENDGTDMAAYYSSYAGAYEQEVYGNLELQEELAYLHERVREVVLNHHVLEVACGTGYWTAQLAQAAASVLATDINPEMLRIAQAKGLPAKKVRFVLADAFDLQVAGQFTACFAGMWWSHVKRQDQTRFLGQLRARLGKDALLILLDDTYVEDGHTPIARTDLHGNTYQFRTLSDGKRYEVLKNFPTDSALRKKLGAAAKDIRIARSEHYWMLTCRLK
jgi:SAM-dependent methyltransferase